MPEIRRALDALMASLDQEFSRPNRGLVEDIEAQKQLMIAVATGGPAIDSVNAEYIERRARIRQDLSERGIQDPNQFPDLWKWYGKWSADLRGYQARREFVTNLYQPLIDHLLSGPAVVRPRGPTGWERVDRGMAKLLQGLASASTEEDYQTVGLLCREVLISLAQEVYNSDRHRLVDDVEPSETDARRMLEAFIATELAGGLNEEVRRYAKAALSLANALTHRRTANYRDAALCLEATTSVINIVATVTGHRVPAGG